MRYSILMMIAVLLATSCAGKSDGSIKKNTPDASVSLTRRAWEMRRDGVPVDSIILVQEKAVEELRKGTSPDNPVEVLEQMGYLYNIAGDYA